MIKESNIYWFVLFLIVAIQLFVPPNIGKIYYFFIIYFVVFLFNGGFKLLINRFKKTNNPKAVYLSELFQRMDYRQFSLQLNNISVSTFLYFMYIHMMVISNAIDEPSGIKKYVYPYRGKSYFLTYREAEALHFWEFASFSLIASSIIIEVVFRFRKKRKLVH
ncbi:MAG: hypothetical protein C0599_16375 [Salinivirgaceae bacterium]|nr:MAG: hypothetical protein C0599_16375 [Salinivirgaceae bacterium]